MDRSASLEGSEVGRAEPRLAPAPPPPPGHDGPQYDGPPPPPMEKPVPLPGEVGQIGESERDLLTFDWNQKLTCGCCSCFSYLLQLVLLASCGSFLFGFNLSLLNTSIAHIMWEYGWCDLKEEITGCTAATNYSAFINTSIFIGAAIGSMTGGVFMKFGRRIMMLMSMAVFVFGIIASCCANSFSALLFARLVCGYAVGLVSVCVPAYMSEVTPPAVRGKYGVYHQLFITVGILAGTLVGLPLALSDPVPDGLPDVEGGSHPEIGTFSRVWWRVMLGLAILPVLLVTYLLMKVYTFETPHYYIEQNHYGDAEMLLRKILNKAEVATELKEITDEIEFSKAAAEKGMSLGAACGRSDYRFVIFYGCLLSAFQQLGGINVFIASSNELFEEAGLEGHMPTVMTVIMSLINCVMTIPAVYLIERLGRRTLMIIGTVCMTLFVLPATIMYWVDEESDVTMWLAIVGCLGYIIFFACTYGPILWVYLFEIYPVEIKGSAAGLATAFNWIAGIIMVFVQNYLENKVLYLIFTIMCGIGAVIVFVWMKETKGRVLGDSPFVNKN